MTPAAWVRVLFGASVAALLVAMGARVGGTTADVPAGPAPNRVVTITGVPQPAAPSPGQPTTAAATRALLDRYCVACHNQRTRIPAASPLRLDTADVRHPGTDPDTWEKVVRKLAVGAMPPKGFPSPGEPALSAVQSWLSHELDVAAEARTAPGRYVVHRLNRSEYANAVRDLLAIEVDVTELLPSDGGNFGFDNVAAALTPSPMLLERYLTAALRISALAIGDPDVTPLVSTYSIDIGVTQDDYVEGLPLGTRGGAAVRHIFPADGEYVFSAHLLRTMAEGYAGVEGHEREHQFVITIDGQEIHRAPVGGASDHFRGNGNHAISQPLLDARMTSRRVVVTAGSHDVGFTWMEQPSLEQSVWQPSRRASQGGHDPSGLPRLQTLNIEGPFQVRPTSETASRQRVLVCHPVSTAEESGCAEQVFTALARRAFRRPVTAEDIAGPLAFYRTARQDGGDFDAGIRAGIAVVLTSPSFLFRIEQDPTGGAPGSAHPVSEVELASRLSFFLWSSIPDDELLEAAEAGRLRAPGVLDTQVRRMIRDRRADALVSNFAGQWLQLRNLDSLVVPNLTQFPDFDDNLKQAMRRETELLVAAVLREERGAIDLLQADYTFVNERLARHYGIPGVYGARFRRVPTSEARRGLLGHASILALTSTATRTSPVFRGVFVLKNLLNLPPSPPPPNVPQLEASGGSGGPLTVRQQLERHRANAVCATCHRTIDPIGFALEHFDAVGQWRETTGDGVKVDATGILLDGTAVDGPVRLRDALVARPNVFVGTVTEKLLVYALGRGLDASDMPLVRRIVSDAAAQDYRLSALILGIVGSPAFQMRTQLEGPMSGEGAMPTATGNR